MGSITKKTISIENSEKLGLITGGLLIVYGGCKFLIPNKLAIIWWLVACISLIALIAGTFLLAPEKNDEFSAKCRGLAGSFACTTMLLIICLISLLRLFYPIPVDMCWIVIGLSKISYSASYLYHERKGA